MSFGAGKISFNAKLTPIRLLFGTPLRKLITFNDIFQPDSGTYVDDERWLRHAMQDFFTNSDYFLSQLVILLYRGVSEATNKVPLMLLLDAQFELPVTDQAQAHCFNQFWFFSIADSDGIQGISAYLWHLWVFGIQLAPVVYVVFRPFYPLRYMKKGNFEKL